MAASRCRRPIQAIRILFLVTLAVLVLISSRAMSQQAAEPSGTIKVTQEEYYKKGGLRAAASVTGSYTRSERQYWDGDPATLKELADLSHVIVIGKWDTARCELTSDGRSITTVHSVVVESTLKGEREPTILEVSLPGGKAQFEDGSTSEVITPGFARPQIARRVLWFLRREGVKVAGPRNANESRYTTTRGPLGVFDLEPEGRRFVAPAGAFSGPLAQRLLRQRLSPEAFVNAVTEAVR
jgi:hypothetical protein